MWLTLDELRDIADKIEHGKRESAGFLIYPAVPYIPADQLPSATAPCCKTLFRHHWSPHQN